MSDIIKYVFRYERNLYIMSRQAGSVFFKISYLWTDFDIFFYICGSNIMSCRCDLEYKSYVQKWKKIVYIILSPLSRRGIQSITALCQLRHAESPPVNYCSVTSFTGATTGGWCRGESNRDVTGEGWGVGGVLVMAYVGRCEWETMWHTWREVKHVG